MNKLLTFVLAAMAFAACTQNEVEELTANRADVPETLTVGFEGGDTRVELNEALKTVWTEGDEVSVYFYSDANQKWQYQGETGERLGTLRRVDASVATTQTDYVVVAYPYNTSYTLNRINANLIASLPAVQSYKDGSYGAEGNIMVAQSEFTQFSLKSVCGWLRVELTGEGEVVESVKVRGNNGEQVAGLIYVDTATAEATLAAEMGEASDEEEVGGIGGGLELDNTVFTEVTLDCGSGVELGAEATAFYVALLPQTFEKGMTIDINYANAEPQTLVCENSITISRNHISPIESEANEEADVPSNQLWYTATASVEPDDTSAFNVAIVSNEWDEATGEGIITFDGELTTIGSYAFHYCDSLTSITIPDSVTTIGNYTFCDCDSLTSITIPDSVTTIGGGVFGGCSNLAEFKGKFAADGGRCLIIDGVLNAFAVDCGATEYTIPDSVTTIGDVAFGKCHNLTSVTIPDSVMTIGYNAFFNCDSLTSVTIPDSVTTIGNQAFCYCSSLTSVTIGDNVTTIGDYAFAYCYDLTSVTISDSVTTIGDSAFRSCSSLAEFKGKFAADGGRCLIKDNAIIAYAEASGTTYTIPDSVTSIGKDAFRECGSLTSVTIGDSVTTIGDSAFYYCYSLTSVTIPDSVTSIGEYAFYNCRRLTSIYCKATTPPSLGYNAFKYYDNGYVVNIGCAIYVPAESVEEYKAATNWCEYADHIVEYDYNSTMTISYTTSDGMPANANGLIVSNSYQNGVGELIYIGKDIIPEYLFYNCDNLTSLTIPDSVTTIGDSAFFDCDSLTIVTIPDSVTTIGKDAFRECTSLTSVTIGDSVTTIGEDAFAYCYDLTSVTIPNSVTTIGDLAFYGCSSLTSVTIPDSVTTIGGGAFASCHSLAEFKDKFAADGGRCLIKDNTIIAYANASGTTYTIPDSVTTIGVDAFYNCDSLTSVTIPDSVTTIGEGAFDDCNSLTSVTIPDSVTTIGVQAFCYCSSLTSVTIPDSVTTIGEDAFYGCSSLTSVTIPDSVTAIEDYAFYYCSSLTSVTIPDSVTTIGEGAFNGCYSLTSVTIPDSVTTIGDYAFGGCSSLTSVYCKAITPPSLGYRAFKYYDNGYVNLGCAIYVPAESVEAYKAAENWSEYAADIVGYDFETGEVVE